MDALSKDSNTPCRSADRVMARRDLFWQNVVRDILMALAAAAASGGRLSPTPTGAAHSPSPVNEIFDGRLALVTTLGQRIPIADVYPVFACSALRPDPQTRALSDDVQATVFRVKTPAGEAYTLPISSISSFHSLSSELIARLEQATTGKKGDDDQAAYPFGFAAFTSMARAEADGSLREPEMHG